MGKYEDNVQMLSILDLGSWIPTGGSPGKIHLLRISGMRGSTATHSSMVREEVGTSKTED